MSNAEIIKKVKDQLDKAGREWDLTFEVGEVAVESDGWLQVFVKSDSVKKNRAAEAQIIADVEDEISQESNQEVLLIKVSDLTEEIA